jgi:hypothetical protein
LSARHVPLMNPGSEQGCLEARGRKPIADARRNGGHSCTRECLPSAPPQTNKARGLSGRANCLYNAKAKTATRTRDGHGRRRRNRAAPRPPLPWICCPSSRASDGPPPRTHAARVAQPVSFPGLGRAASIFFLARQAERTTTGESDVGCVRTGKTGARNKPRNMPRLRGLVHAAWTGRGESACSRARKT